ncbi:MAG: acyl carrier protein [Actinocatenispora sp.]
MTDEMTSGDVDAGIRSSLADVLYLDEATVTALPGDTPLFGGTLGLSSLTGVRLLARVRDLFGVDVAAEDLTLDSLASIDTLTGFVIQHLRLRAGRT